jgi:tetratricopeptide (TPR) repeat protein
VAVAIAAAPALSGAGCGSAALSASAEERATKSVALYKQGVAEFNDGKIDEAIANLKKANELQPGYTLLRYDLARMLLHRAQVTDTASIRASADAKELRQADQHEKAKQKEDEAQNLFRRAVGDFREARDLLIWVADQRPVYEANVYYFLAKAYTGLGEFKLALKNLDTAIELGQPTGKDRENLLIVRERLLQAQAQEERLGKR